MINEKKITKLSVDFYHIFGGLLTGLSLAFLVDIKTASHFTIVTDFAMFLTLLLLGLSYLGE